MESNESNREIIAGILKHNISGTDGSLEGQSLSCRIAMVYALLEIADAIKEASTYDCLKCGAKVKNVYTTCPSCEKP